jgi:hypothetical protein
MCVGPSEDIVNAVEVIKEGCYGTACRTGDIHGKCT